MRKVGRLGCLVALAASLAAAVRADALADAIQHGVTDKASGPIHMSDATNHPVQAFRAQSGTE
jgi:hypothetical protein